MELIIDFTLTFPIRDDFYLVIQGFLAYYNLHPGLKMFWTKKVPSNQLYTFYDRIIAIQTNLILKFDANMKLRTDESMQSNMIIIKLLLMICANRIFQNAIQARQSTKMQTDMQGNVTIKISQLFEMKNQRFDLDDDQYIQAMYEHFFLEETFRKLNQLNSKDDLKKRDELMIHHMSREIKYVYSFSILTTFFSKEISLISSQLRLRFQINLFSI